MSVRFKSPAVDKSAGTPPELSWEFPPELSSDEETSEESSVPGEEMVGA